MSIPNHDLASLLQIKQHFISANDTISSAFPNEQHANPLTIYLRMIALSINQHAVQLQLFKEMSTSKTVTL